MHFVNLDQQIFVPVVDETHGGATYEMKMTVGEFFGKFCKGFEPKTVEAISVEWLRKKIKEHTDDEGWQDYIANSFGLCIEEWQNEQEAQK